MREHWFSLFLSVTLFQFLLLLFDERVHTKHNAPRCAELCVQRTLANKFQMTATKPKEKFEKHYRMCWNGRERESTDHRMGRRKSKSIFDQWIEFLTGTKFEGPIIWFCLYIFRIGGDEGILHSSEATVDGRRYRLDHRTSSISDVFSGLRIQCACSCHSNHRCRDESNRFNGTDVVWFSNMCWRLWCLVVC